MFGSIIQDVSFFFLRERFFLSRLGRHFGVIVAVAPNDIHITFLDSDDPVCLFFVLASGHDMASDFSPSMLREIKLGIPGIGQSGPRNLPDHAFEIAP